MVVSKIKRHTSQDLKTSHKRSDWGSLLYDNDSGMFKKSLLEILGSVRCTPSDPENTMFDLDASIDGLPVWGGAGLSPYFG